MILKYKKQNAKNIQEAITFGENLSSQKFYKYESLSETLLQEVISVCKKIYCKTAFIKYIKKKRLHSVNEASFIISFVSENIYNNSFSYYRLLHYGLIHHPRKQFPV